MVRFERLQDNIGSLTSVAGVTPAYFRWRARQQISEYDTVHLTNGTVDQIVPEANNTYFTVVTQNANGTSSSATARKIILATGLRDLIPSTPGLQENFGKGIFWCPWCDGYEHVDQPFGVLGSLGSSGNTPLEVLSLNEDIILFVNGTDVSSPKDGRHSKRVLTVSHLIYLPMPETYAYLHTSFLDPRTACHRRRETSRLGHMAQSPQYHYREPDHHVARQAPRWG